MLRRLLPVLAAFPFLWGCTTQTSPTPPAHHPVQGVWIVKESQVKGPGVDTTYHVQPGTFILTKNHYSFTWPPRTTRAPDFETKWKPNDEEKLKEWGWLIASSGIYDANDTTITIRPLAATTPEFIGGRQVFRYWIRGDSMWTRSLEVYSYDGVRDPIDLRYTVTRKLIRAESPDGSAHSPKSTTTSGKEKEMAKHPIVWWELASHDSDSSVAFFKKVFDWPLEFNDRLGFHVMPGMGEDAPGGGIFTLKKAKLPFLTLFIQVDDVDAKAKEVEQAGGFIVEAPFDISERSRICLFNEPSGVKFAMIQLRETKDEG